MHPPADFSFPITGAWLGLCTGFWLCTGYLILPILGVGLVTCGFGQSCPLPTLAAWLGALILSFLIGGLIGLIPAMLLGMLTGWLVGWGLTAEYLHRSRFRAWGLGTVLCIGLSVGGYHLFGINWLTVLIDPAHESVPWFAAITRWPSVIYVLSGGWGSLYLWTVAQQQACTPDRAAPSNHALQPTPQRGE